MANLRIAQDQVANGEVIVELDVSLIDASIVADRLSTADHPEMMDFIESIRKHGQRTPILVRPHPTTEGRYQVAYGHRRLHALRIIGRPIKAQITNLSDDELVIAQGQENRDRLDLSFIERSLFAKRLEEKNFKRETICAALKVDNPQLTRMLQVARGIPFELIEKIGSAPSVGRRRWMEMSDALKSLDWNDVKAEVLLAAGTTSSDSDERFGNVMSALLQRTSIVNQGRGLVVADPHARGNGHSDVTVGSPRKTMQNSPLPAPSVSTHVYLQDDHNGRESQISHHSAYKIAQTDGEIRIVYENGAFSDEEINVWINQIRDTCPIRSRK
jgi:plasmid partitioning protein RepB